MDVIYGLIPGMVFLGLVAVAVLFWAARSGQFDDLEGDAQRILMDDDELPPADNGDLNQADSNTDQHSSITKEDRGEKNVRQHKRHAD